jgi:uncharacterized protein YjbI with pentapeptide repeats
MLSAITIIIVDSFLFSNLRFPSAKAQVTEKDMEALKSLSQIISGCNSATTTAGANLSNCYLRSSDLSNANLQGANLQGAHFEFANLKNSNLQSTSSKLTEISIYIY